MDKIIKGTTPSILLDFDEFPLDVYDIVKISMIIQHGQKEWDVTDDIAFNREELQAVYHFSQSQTLALSKNHEIYFEADVLMNNGEVYRVAEGTYGIKPTMRKGVLTYGL